MGAYGYGLGDYMAICENKPFTTKAKRKNKADKLLVRRGISEMDPFNLIVDEAESSVAVPISSSRPTQMT